MNNTKRLSINITERQAEKLNKYIRWGERRSVFDTIIDDLITIANTNPRDIDDLAAKRKHLWDLEKEESE